jgi:alanine racemase
MGFPSPEDLLKVADLPGLRITGIMSHFAEADLSDSEFTAHQVRAFRAVRDSLEARGVRPLAHMANSAGALYFPEARFDAIRPGLALYGCPPREDAAPSAPGLRPVMSARAGILSLRRLAPGSPISYGRTFVTVRETLVAVLAAGYADGYPRSCSNKGRALVRGAYAPVLGRVCMDLTVVDVTDIPGVLESDEAVLLGSDGPLSIGAWELARAAGTVPYEILTGFGRAAART